MKLFVILAVFVTFAAAWPARPVTKRELLRLLDAARQGPPPSGPPPSGPPPSGPPPSGPPPSGSPPPTPTGSGSPPPPPTGSGSEESNSASGISGSLESQSGSPEGPGPNGAVSIDEIYETIGERLREVVGNIETGIEGVLAIVGQENPHDPTTLDHTTVGAGLESILHAMDHRAIKKLNSLFSRIVYSGIEGRGPPPCVQTTGAVDWQCMIGLITTVAEEFEIASEELFANVEVPEQCMEFLAIADQQITTSEEFVYLLNQALPCVAFHVYRLPNIITHLENELADGNVDVMMLRQTMMKVVLMAHHIVDQITEAKRPIDAFLNAATAASKHGNTRKTKKNQERWFCWWCFGR